MVIKIEKNVSGAQEARIEDGGTTTVIRMSSLGDILWEVAVWQGFSRDSGWPLLEFGYTPGRVLATEYFDHLVEKYSG